MERIKGYLKEKVYYIASATMNVSRIGYHTGVTKKKYADALLEGERALGTQVYQIFTKNPRQFRVDLVDSEGVQARRCQEWLRTEGRFLVSHASYLLNMANPEKWEEKVTSGVAELRNIFALGGYGCVFHVGKSLKMEISEALDLMERYIVEVLEGAWDAGTRDIFYIIETAAGCGTELLTKIPDLGFFHKRFTSEKYLGREAVYGRVKICVDTCHIFSAGYGLHSAEATAVTLATIEEHIGWENVACIHLNDSLSLKGCGCKLDRHGRIGKGFIGAELRHFLARTLTLGIPHILETPYEEGEMYSVHREEIELIQSWFY